MEKKNNRSIQSSAKGIGTDSKKSQDVNKPWPRGSRRREPQGGAFPKNEAARKPATQQRKPPDKRPRPRGYYYSGPVGGKEDAGLDELEAELGSVYLQGSKKQSLNHLLNFHFESREGRNSAATSSSKSGHRFSGMKHKYNKEEFLQANCQFIVRESGDYKPYLNNPDALVNWELIEQVNIHVLDFPSCPVCLYPPVAAKMTRCGHIYCYSCILHYLALSDKTWRKCPICYEAVNKTDLKSVVAIAHNTFNVDEIISFKLMKRLRGCLTAYPAKEQIQERLTAVPYQDANMYSKLQLAGRLEVLAIIRRERAELQLQLAEDANSPELCFVEQALALLAERELAWSHPMNVTDNLCCHPLLDSLPRLGEVEVLENTRLEVAADGRESLDGKYANKSIEDADVDHKSSKYFYFYQASDGQHIYLHALNVRMLEDTYGCLESCPETIKGRIVEKESSSITEELRNRLRYLQHLPVTCQFEVAEIQLTTPVVSKTTLAQFKEQIEMRRKRRQRRARDEKRREKRITEEENKLMGKFVDKNNISIESHHQFPDFQPEVAKAGCSNQNQVPAQASPVAERSVSPCSQEASSASASGSSLNTENEYPGLSFAKMLSSNKTPKSIWPVRKTAKVMPSEIRNDGKSPKTSESDPDVVGYVSVPAFNQSFGDSIALALEKASAQLGTDGDLKMSGKKKKNKQKKILFATSMSYSCN